MWTKLRTKCLIDAKLFPIAFPCIKLSYYYLDQVKEEPLSMPVSIVKNTNQIQFEQCQSGISSLVVCTPQTLHVSPELEYFTQILEKYHQHAKFQQLILASFSYTPGTYLALALLLYCLTLLSLN